MNESEVNLVICFTIYPKSITRSSLRKRLRLPADFKISKIRKDKNRKRITLSVNPDDVEIVQTAVSNSKSLTCEVPEQLPRYQGRNDVGIVEERALIPFARSYPPLAPVLPRLSAIRDESSSFYVPKGTYRRRSGGCARPATTTASSSTDTREPNCNANLENLFRNFDSENTPSSIPSVKDLIEADDILGALRVLGLEDEKDRKDYFILELSMGRGLKKIKLEVDGWVELDFGEDQ